MLQQKCLGQSLEKSECLKNISSFLCILAYKLQKVAEWSLMSVVLILLLMVTSPIVENTPLDEKSYNHMIGARPSHLPVCPWHTKQCIAHISYLVEVYQQNELYL